MIFRSTSIAAVAALAVLLCGTASDAKPARKPAAAARAKPAKPAPKPAAEVEAEPASAEQPAGEAKEPSKLGEAFSDLLSDPAQTPLEPPLEAAPAADEVPDETAPPAAEAVASEPAPPPIEVAATEDKPAAEDGADEPAGPETPADDAVPAASSPKETLAAFKKGDPPTSAFMVGVWVEEGKKCDTALDFKADGKLIGPFPGWQLSEEGVLTMTGSRQQIWLKVVDKDTMQSRRSETDPPRMLKRCLT